MKGFVSVVLVLSLSGAQTAGAEEGGTLSPWQGEPVSPSRIPGSRELFSPPFFGSGLTGDARGEGGGLTASLRAVVDTLPPARGNVGVESLIGKRDTMMRLYVSSTPATANALITYTVNGKGGYCTGWFYGPNVLATAGHCVHEGKGGGYHDNITVYPAYDAGVAPFGAHAAMGVYAPSAWRDGGNDDYDYGLIALEQNIGTSVGYYGVWAKSGSLKGLPAIITGYPSGKSPAKSLWASSDIVRISKSRQIFYKNDTSAGQSGSAVWLDRPVAKGLDDGPYAYAIHTYGTSLSATSTSAYNSATRIDKSAFENMMMFRDMNKMP
jgi:glutamyl endopeptidase